MALKIVEFVVGLALAIAVLRDVFDTVVAPGESRGTLKIARRLVFATLPVWRWARSRRGGISTSFAPFVLVGSFVIWMVLLVLGFGLMCHGLGESFKPTIPSFPQALFVAGSALVTVGLSETDATGAARWVLLAGGFCGLAVMTMAVTYLLEVQTSIAQRDAGILKLTTSAGEPPSGLALLERYAALDFPRQVEAALHAGRDWCAAVQQSHGTHPSLIYFRSTGTGSGWPAALGALMDLALMVEFLIEAPQWRGLAVLVREEGGRMAEALIEVVGLPHELKPPAPAEVEQLLGRLAAAGYPLRATPDRDGFARQRARHEGCVAAMSAHLGTPAPPLVPEPRPAPASA